MKKIAKQLKMVHVLNRWHPVGVYEISTRSYVWNATI